MFGQKLHNWRALLGLLALVLPLVAGFAHHHDTRAGYIEHGQHAPLASSGYHAEASEHGNAGSQNDHHHHDHDGDDGHPCSICVALAALRSAQLPDTTTVLPPSTVTVSAVPVCAIATPPKHASRAHGARAPPPGLAA